jgi:hypothetical protein
VFWVFLATVCTCLAVWSTTNGKVPVRGETKWLARRDAPAKYFALLATLWALAVALWTYAAWVLWVR